MTRERLQWLIGQWLIHHASTKPCCPPDEQVRVRARWLAYSRLPKDEPRPRFDGSIITIPLRQQR